MRMKEIIYEEASARLNQLKNQADINDSERAHLKLVRSMSASLPAQN